MKLWFLVPTDLAIPGAKVGIDVITSFDVHVRVGTFSVETSIADVIARAQEALVQTPPDVAAWPPAREAPDATVISLSLEGSSLKVQRGAGEEEDVEIWKPLRALLSDV